MNNTHQLTYRPEIDGLRTIAIVPVILYHMGWNQLSAGFIGVDIFFVISGFLITGLILDQLKNDNFTFADFYLNRSKRILPSFFAVCGLTLIPAILLMQANELASYGESLISALFYVSNIYFRYSSDYFSPSSENLPLLHTWSLSIEEQFYLFIPALIIFSIRRKISITKLMLILAGISFLLCVLGSFRYPVANFYLLPTRAWELFVGSLLALQLKNVIFQFRSKKLPSIISFIGISLISLSFIVISYTKSNPGIATLLPIIGTLLIIGYCTNGDFVYQFLTFKPMLWIGQRSYVLYLVHFPILAFVNIYQANYAVPIPMAAYGLAFIALTEGIHQGIEKPFRKIKTSSHFFYILLFSLQILLILTGIFIYRNASELKPITANQKLIQSQFSFKSETPSWDDCSNRSILEPCRGGLIGAQHQIVLMGDSHSFTLFNQLSEQLKFKQVELILYTNGNCPPILLKKTKFDDCLEKNNQILKKLQSQDNISAIILIARWSWYIKGKAFDNGVGGKGEKSNDFLDIYYSTTDERESFFKQRFKASINEFIKLGKPLYVVNTIPEPGWNVPKKSIQLDSSIEDISKMMVFPFQHYLARNQVFSEILNQLSFIQNLHVIQSSDTFCNHSECHTWLDGYPLYFDDNHISNYGAELLTKALLAEMSITK